MSRGMKPLTQWEVESCRTAFPQMLRAAFYGEDVSGFGMELAGDAAQGGAAGLCCLLSPGTLARIHGSAAVRWQDAEAVYLPDEAAERRGRVLFRVRLAFEGSDASGEPLSLREEAVIAVYCRQERRGLFQRELCVTGTAVCTEEAGRILSPDPPQRSKRRRDALAEGALEVLLEIVMEFIGELLDGV